LSEFIQAATTVVLQETQLFKETMIRLVWNQSLNLHPLSIFFPFSWLPNLWKCESASPLWGMLCSNGNLQFAHPPTCGTAIEWDENSELSLCGPVLFHGFYVSWAWFGTVLPMWTILAIQFYTTIQHSAAFAIQEISFPIIIILK
jgi:hypothetical protein